jgi:hypothetical protein
VIIPDIAVGDDVGAHQRHRAAGQRNALRRHRSSAEQRAAHASLGIGDASTGAANAR